MNSISLYAARDSGLHRLHPLTKAIVAVSVLVLALAWRGNWSAYALVIGIILPLALWGRVLPNLLRAVWKVSWPLALSVLLIQGLFWGQGTTIFQAGFLAVKAEGIWFGLASIGRILLVMSDFTLFAMTTRPDFLMLSLKQIGVPGSLAYIVVTTLQIIPRFQSKAATIMDAQRSRGLETEGNLLVRARAVLPLVLPLVLGSLVEVEERAIAIEARAFNSNNKASSLIEIPDSSGQAISRWIIVAVAVSALVASILWR